MHRVVDYTLFFLIMVLLQVFLFNNLDMSVYLHPLVYIAFALMLPLETLAVVVLLLGVLTGVRLDFMMGTAGLNTIATAFTAVVRLPVLSLLVGKDEVKGGGVPTPGRLGYGRFFRYVGVMVFIQCFVFFTAESLQWEYYHLTLLRVVLSSALTVILVWLAQMLLPGAGGRQKQHRD